MKGKKLKLNFKELVNPPTKFYCYDSVLDFGAFKGYSIKEIFEEYNKSAIRWLNWATKEIPNFVLSRKSKKKLYACVGRPLEKIKYSTHRGSWRIDWDDDCDCGLSIWDLLDD